MPSGFAMQRGLRGLGGVLRLAFRRFGGRWLGSGGGYRAFQSQNKNKNEKQEQEYPR